MSDINEEQKRLYKRAEENDIQILSRWQDPTIEDLKEEINRLNNIINELEKWLKEQNDEHYSWHYREWIRQVLDKLNELKGDNK